MESVRQTQNEEELFSLRPLAARPMKALLTLLAAAAATVASTATLFVEPATAQWGAYGLSQQQLQQQRGNGWSSGDYFGAPQQPRMQQQPYGGGYTPGLQHNMRYRQNSCAMYLNC